MRLDHVGIMGPDLDSLRTAWVKLGFAPTMPDALMEQDASGGAKRSLGQRSCHLVFEHGYCELTSVAEGRADHHLASYRARSPELNILALGAPDLGAQRARLIAAGIESSELRFASRAITYGQLTGQARFEWFMIDPAASPRLLTCFVKGLTPELVYQREVQQHPNSVIGLTGLSLVVDDPSRAGTFFARVTGRDLDLGDSEARIHLDHGWLRFYTADAFNRRFTAVSGTASGSRAAMTLSLRSVDALRESCKASGIPLNDADGTYWIDASDGAGVTLEFSVR